jgi:hypothetical protein
MIDDYIVDMDPTYELLGPPAFSIEDGVQAVADWLDCWKSKSDDWRPIMPRQGAAASHSQYGVLAH